MNHTALFVALIIALPCAAQVVRNPPAFASGDPAFKIVKHDETGKNGYLTVWKGRVTLTGSLVIEFDRGSVESEKDTSGAAFFEPDEESLRRLPAATSFYAKAPKVLWLPQSPSQLLTPLIGKKAFSAVVSGKSGRYAYPVQIVITEFSTSIDCDNRSYSARIVQTRLLPQQQLAIAEPLNLGC